MGQRVAACRCRSSRYQLSSRAAIACFCSRRYPPVKKFHSKPIKNSSPKDSVLSFVGVCYEASLSFFGLLVVGYHDTG